MSEYRRKVIYNIRYSDTDKQALGKIIANNAAEIAQEINYLLASKQYQQAKKICEYAFTNFYGGASRGYKPHMYKRTGGMKNVADYGIKNREIFTFAFDSSLMGNHRSNEAVYELDFKQGYHGGKKWRTPTPQFIAKNGPSMVQTDGGMKFASHPWQYWHPDTVPVTASPYKIITTSWNNYIDNIYPGQKLKIIEQVLSKYISKVR